MQNKKMKFLSVLLAGLMLLSVTACGQTDDPNVDDSDGLKTSLEEDTGDPNYTCDLPKDLNFQNTGVSILYSNEDGPSDELRSEKLGLGTLSDAVYERNLAVENQLAVKLEMVGDDNAMGRVDTLINSGDTSIDIFAVPSFLGIGRAMSGYYLNLNDSLYTDTSKHYWAQEFNEIMTFTDEDMQFLATSSAALTLFRMSYLTIFNKDLMDERGLPNLYNLVDNGEWTLDQQYQIALNAYADTNGNGTRDRDDFYGFLGGTKVCLDGYSVACGIHLVTRDENGDLHFNADEVDRMVTMAEKVSALYNCPGTLRFNGFAEDNIGVYHIIEKFATETSLMATTQFLSMERRINELADIAYGVVPMPKMTAEQETYNTYVQDRVTCFGISAAIGDEERQDVLSAVMESLAYNSYVIVRPAYYDTTLSLRFMQDPQSREMLDIMFESISFDLCSIVSIGGVRQGLRDVLPSSNPPIVSHFKVWSRDIINTVNSYNKSLDKLISEAD